MKDEEEMHVIQDSVAIESWNSRQRDGDGWCYLTVKKCYYKNVL